MKKLILIIFILTGILLWADVIDVPGDFDTIQGAIDVAEDGDEVIVSPGTYYENIDFDGKAITIASLFYTTQDTSYISQTVIDGGMQDRVVMFNSEEDANSVLTGFTITHGFSVYSGGGIYAGVSCSPTLNNLHIIENQTENSGGGFYFNEYCSPVISNLLVEGNSAYNGGGGAYAYYCDLIMEDSKIRDNECEHYGGGLYSRETDLQLENVQIEDNHAGDGGGLYLWGFNSFTGLYNVLVQHNQAEEAGGIYSRIDMYLENVTISENIATSRCGGLRCSGAYLYFAEEPGKRCSIYLNEAGERIGRDLYGSYGLQEVFLADFTVSMPTVFFAAPLGNYIFDIQAGVVQQVDADLYVSTTGSNENSGLSAAEPLKTIQKASEIILPSSENPHTIYLEEGIYSSATNAEPFPVYPLQGINIQGADRDSVILISDGTTQVMICEDVENTTISGMTLTNGCSEMGAGITCLGSDITLKNMLIMGNEALGSGGGIYLYESNANLENLVIANNTCAWSGGGIYLDTSNLLLVNVTSTCNESAGEGGGMCSFRCNVSMVNSIFWNDSPEELRLSAFFSNDTLTVAYCDIEGGINGIEGDFLVINWLDDNMDEDPNFLDAVNGDYHLADNSPCIDAGVSYFEYEGELLLDLQEDEYWGEAPDMGACEYIAIENDNSVIESGKLKMGNYPNPFNPETTIAFYLPEECEVELGIYNLRGQLVEKLISGELAVGEHFMNWSGRSGLSGRSAGSGIYIVRLKAGEKTEMRKILMVK